MKLSEILDLGLLPDVTIKSLRKYSIRWDDFPQPNGRDGAANKYDPDAVIECVQSHRGALQVVS
jgi:hypothetical protein